MITTGEIETGLRRLEAAFRPMSEAKRGLYSEKLRALSITMGHWRAVVEAFVDSRDRSTVPTIAEIMQEYRSSIQPQSDDGKDEESEDAIEAARAEHAEKWARAAEKWRAFKASDSAMAREVEQDYDLFFPGSLSVAEGLDPNLKDSFLWGFWDNMEAEMEQVAVPKPEIRENLIQKYKMLRG